MEDPKNQIEIIEDAEIVQENEVEKEELEYNKEEIELAKKHGLLKEEESDELKKQPDAVTKDNKVKEKKQEEVELPTFDQVESDEKLITKYNKNEKALYWKWKTDKNKRQEAQKELQDLKEKYGTDYSKVSSYEKKLQKINKLITEDVDSLTIEGLKAVLEEKEVVENKIEDISPSVDIIKQKVSQKAQLAERIGESTYENFQAIANLAKEVIESDKSGTYQSLIDKSFTDDNVDEIALLERIVKIAQLSDKFHETSTSDKKSEDKPNEKVDRILNNSKKKISSASITSSGGRRTISENELTCAQAARLPISEYSKLSEATRQRVKMGIDP